jgi:hypothetical protein
LDERRSRGEARIKKDEARVTAFIRKAMQDLGHKCDNNLKEIDGIWTSFRVYAGAGSADLYLSRHYLSQHPISFRVTWDDGNRRANRPLPKSFPATLDERWFTKLVAKFHEDIEFRKKVQTQKIAARRRQDRSKVLAAELNDGVDWYARVGACGDPERVSLFGHHWKPERAKALQKAFTALLEAEQDEAAAERDAARVAQDASLDKLENMADDATD